MYESDKIQRKKIKRKNWKVEKVGTKLSTKKKLVPNMETDVEIYLATVSGEL